MATARKAVAMCCVTIGYNSYLLPADKGMKMVEIMQSAVDCDERYTEGMTYTVGAQPQVRLTLVKPSQLRQSDDCRPGVPLMLEGATC